MSKIRDLITSLLGLAALTLLILVIVWLYRAQSATPEPVAGAQPAAALQATPTIPAEMEFATPVPPEEAPEPTPTVPTQFESPLATPTADEVLPEPVLEVQPVAAEALSDDTISFLREGNLYLVNASTRATAQVSVSGNVERLYGWSHDRTRLLVGVGKRAVVTESEMPAGSDLWVVDVRAGKAVQLTEGLVMLESYWSPAADQVAYWTRDGDVYLVGSDGSSRKRLLSSLAADYLDWSPDGTELAFVLLKDPGEWAVRNIAAIRVSDGLIRQLTADPSENYSPLWSLDGNEVLFQSERPRPPDTGVWYVVSADGTNLRHLAGSPPFIATGERRSPTADLVAYELGDSIWVMDFQGNAQRLTEGRHPVWSPDGGRLAYIGRDGGLWLISLDGTGAQSLGEAASELAWAQRREAGGRER